MGSRALTLFVSTSPFLLSLNEKLSRQSPAKHRGRRPSPPCRPPRLSCRESESDITERNLWSDSGGRERRRYLNRKGSLCFGRSIGCRLRTRRTVPPSGPMSLNPFFWVPSGYSRLRPATGLGLHVILERSLHCPGGPPEKVDHELKCRRE